MKKPLKKRIKKWKIGDYARQFSIVTGGVLLTLWLTARITEAAKQREVRQAMQLVASELHDNLQVVRDYRYTYGKRRQRRTQDAAPRVAGLCADRVADIGGRVDGDGPGGDLRDGYDVGEFGVGHPGVLHDHFVLDEREHGVAASEAEEPYFQVAYK